MVACLGGILFWYKKKGAKKMKYSKQTIIEKIQFNFVCVFETCIDSIIWNDLKRKCIISDDVFKSIIYIYIYNCYSYEGNDWLNLVKSTTVGNNLSLEKSEIMRIWYTGGSIKWEKEKKKAFIY